jgi:4a-hydroxytetrahydrobiopterin dehydratase
MSVLDDADVDQRLAGVPEWHRGGPPAAQGAGGSSSVPGAITRELTFADFAAAIAFVDRVAELAELANHHPDILVHGWNKVRLTLSTHSAGGLTDADFRLAAQLDDIL